MQTFNSRRIQKGIQFLLIASALANVSFLFSSEKDRTPAVYEKEEPPYSYEQLKELIEANKTTIKSIDDLIGQLPASLKSNFTLMYDSQSLQPADFVNPRVIMFTQDAKLTCSYGKGDTLECIQYRDQEKKFDFHEIKFEKEIRFSKLNETVDGKTSCTACHGKDPRPNWESYSQWPGAYGSSDDRLGTGTNEKLGFVEEETQFNLFLKNPLKRYTNLVFHTAENPHFPYQQAIKGPPEFRPNLRYMLATTRLMAERNVRMLGEAFGKKDRYYLLKAYAQCKSGPSISDVLKTRISGTEWTTFFRCANPNSKDCRRNSLGYPTMYSKNPREYYYSTGYQGASLNDFIATYLMRDLIKEGHAEFKSQVEGDLQPVWVYPPSSGSFILADPNDSEFFQGDKDFCALLDRKIGETAEEPPTAKKNPDNSVTFAATCLKCHGTGVSNAPTFPMNDPKALKRLLPKMRERMTRSPKPMPPTGQLLPEHQKIILEYIESIDD